MKIFLKNNWNFVWKFRLYAIPLRCQHEINNLTLIRDNKNCSLT